MLNSKAAALAAGLGFAASLASADTFILVHGAFQDGASWSAVVQGLTAAGHTAVAVTLPGRGDGKPAGEVTMADHVAAVRAAIDGAGGPVMLVGHSFGGMVISATAEADPSNIATLVYVAAYLPRVGTTPGDSMQELALSDHHGAWQQDSFVVAADYSSASVNPRDRVALFANDTDAATAEAIASAMVDEPLAPLATPVALTPERFGSLRAAYVVTLRDKAVSTNLQLTMIGRGLVAEAVPLDAGHAPQVTATDALVQALITAATPEVE
jgi:pimeloyl-ACP methyl ester carboxylesterase